MAQKYFDLYTKINGHLVTDASRNAFDYFASQLDVSHVFVWHTVEGLPLQLLCDENNLSCKVYSKNPIGRPLMSKLGCIDPEDCISCINESIAVTSMKCHASVQYFVSFINHRVCIFDHFAVPILSLLLRQLRKKTHCCVRGFSLPVRKWTLGKKPSLGLPYQNHTQYSLWSLPFYVVFISLVSSVRHT